MQQDSTINIDTFANLHFEVCKKKIIYFFLKNLLKFIFKLLKMLFMNEENDRQPAARRGLINQSKNVNIDKSEILASESSQSISLPFVNNNNTPEDIQNEQISFSSIPSSSSTTQPIAIPTLFSKGEDGIKITKQVEDQKGMLHKKYQYL